MGLVTDSTLEQIFVCMILGSISVTFRFGLYVQCY